MQDYNLRIFVVDRKFKIGGNIFSCPTQFQSVDVFIHKILNNQHVSTNFNLKFIMLQILLLLRKSANNEYISCYRKETLFDFFLVKMIFIAYYVILQIKQKLVSYNTKKKKMQISHLNYPYDMKYYSKSACFKAIMYMLKVL